MCSEWAEYQSGRWGVVRVRHNVDIALGPKHKYKVHNGEVTEDIVTNYWAVQDESDFAFLDEAPSTAQRHKRVPKVQRQYRLR